MAVKFALIGMAIAAVVSILGAAPRQHTSPVAAGAPSGPAPAHLLLPVHGAVVTQPFGCTEFTLEPFTFACPSRHIHTGLDLAAAIGTPIYAAADGRVQVINSGGGGYGLHVQLTHAGGLLTLYGHLSSTEVTDGQLVTAGSEIGLMGSTGMSTGSHLHFEVRRDGRPVDPVPFLPASLS
ncbi:MAG: M23 family metallopeptidase [Candidatus Dormibacteraeota bacterium]|nr:M23 family metallopeptidase [Candidatus Dormibacteraeota bacterium]